MPILNSFLELNNFVCAFAARSGLPSMITAIEEEHEPNSLIHDRLMSLNQFYESLEREHLVALITSIEFEDAADLQARLRSVLESNHPELFI